MNSLRWLLFAVTVLAVLLGVRLAPGQTPPAPNPQAPTVAMPFPCGMQRGTSLELTLTGTQLAGPVQLWTSFPAAVRFPTEGDNGKEPTRLRVNLTVPSDAPLGFHALRLATTRGVSNLRLFCIDDLPQVLESDSNRSKTTPQPVPVPCVVVGRADPEASDFYKVITSAPGQRLSFEVLGRRLGSPLDPQLTLYDGRTGRELPGGHNNDAPGLQTDARLTYTFKEAGEYLIEIRDTLYRGGSDYVYRLRIGDFPCAATPLPMAVRRGSQRVIGFAGPQVQGVVPLEVTAPNDPALQALTVAPRGPNGLYGWPVSLALSDGEEVLEQEPNNEPAQANRLPVGGGLTGQFQQAGDVDHFVFAARKGQKYVIEAQTHEFHSPAEVYLVLKDLQGNQLAANKPEQGQRLDFTATADADYLLVVEHLLYWGGPAETYRLTVRPAEPGFSLSLLLDRWDVPAGGTLAIPVQVARQDYNGPIEVSVLGPPGLSGRAIIPAGAPAKPNEPAGTLFVHAAAELPLGAGVLTLRGRATVNGTTRVEYATVRSANSQSLGNLPFPPRHLDTLIGLGVTEQPPFTLTAQTDRDTVYRSGTLTFTVSTQRKQEFNEAITLTAVAVPAEVAVAVKNLDPGQQSVQVTVTPSAKAALGPATLAFTGKAKFGGQELAVTTPPVTVNITVPFELQSVAGPIKLSPGGKATVKVTAARQGGYDGPISVELKNLPAGVTAAPSTIAAGQTTVDVELTAAPEAAAQTKSDVTVVGTAEGAGKQQHTSPAVTVLIEKKS